MLRPEKAEPCRSATQAEEKHLTVWRLGECWPYRVDTTLESTVGRLGGRVRVAEGPLGRTEFWSRRLWQKTRAVACPCRGPMRAASAQWSLPGVRFPLFQEFRRWVGICS